MAMTKEEWEEFERAKGKALLRELAKGMADSRSIPSTPYRGEMITHKEWLDMEDEE